MVGGILNAQLSIPISARVRQCHGPSIPATTLPFSNQVCRAGAGGAGNDAKGAGAGFAQRRRRRRRLRKVFSVYEVSKPPFGRGFG